ncbi:hypothetical protein QR680_009965 [Steinernema hermaphroditum]|uniref:Mediator complex subunit 9 n=1 Tax=Steinernema hermaphroditum TaxID=289476 RepID=A0AA39IP60_9BILA|nr:hypothetical protein QR680_009965 [Steinernema hermaphroditum]
MSQHNTGNPEVQACLQQLEQVCTSVLALLQAFDKGSNSEVAQRLKGVDIAFCEIRQRTSAIDDLDNSEYDQVQQRADLERQITLKDELIGRIRNDWQLLDAPPETTKKMSGTESNTQATATETTADQSSSLSSSSVNEKGNNADIVICLHCGSRVLSRDVAKLSSDGAPFALPTAVQRRDAPEVQTEPVDAWWIVVDQFHFDNVGFTRAAEPDGRRYLTCADCEIGPIGWVDEATKHNFVAVNRVGYK